MAGDDGERGGDTAVRDGDSGGPGRGDRRRDAGHHLAVDAGVGEGLCFLASPAEHERVATLQPNDLLALAGEPHEQDVDEVLSDALAGALADVYQLGRR